MKQCGISIGSSLFVIEEKSDEDKMNILWKVYVCKKKRFSIFKNALDYQSYMYGPRAYRLPNVPFANLNYRLR